MPEGREKGARRVLVAQSYFLSFDSKLQEAGQPVPPLGSLICAAVLRDRGLEVSFFDAMLAGSEDECGAALDREKPDVLVIFEDNFNYLTKMCLERMRQAAVRMIALAGERGVAVVIAGSDASDNPRFFLKAGASAVAVGEGELSLAEWLTGPVKAAGSVPGIVSLDHTGSVVSGAARPVVRDLDTLPSPAWDLINLEPYRRVWLNRHGHFSLPLATSRGCPFHCNWCAKPIWGQRYNAMSPARAAREVLTLKALGAARVNVVDDVFGLRPEWLEEFTREVVSQDALLPFKCLSRADLLTERMVRALKHAGCDMVWIGAESGSQKILDAMEKGTTIQDIRSASTRLRQARIRVGYFLQFGYPGETRQDIEATLNLVDDTAPDDIGISVSYPLPGTRFHSRVKDEIGRSARWRDSSDLAMLFNGQHGTRYYRALHAYTHARFRLARALAGRDQGGVRRVVSILRYGIKRVLMAAVLSLIPRGRVRVPSLSPELSREHASTPAMATFPTPSEP